MNKNFCISIVRIFLIAAATILFGHQTIICAETGSTEKVTTTPAVTSEKETETITEAEKKASISQLQKLAGEDPKAAYDLALRYFRGDGVPQNSYKAIQTMRDSGERGFLEAQKALGKLYFSGLEEMGSDLNEAHRWLSMAAGQGDKEASGLLEKVTSAREDDREWSNYRNHLHPYTYRYWYHAPLYRLYWRHGRWRYY